MIDLAAVRKTQNQINKAIWGCAGIAMSASAIAGITGFWNLQQDAWGVASGITTSLAVDTALWVALTSDQLMERAGLSADGPWARAVRWGTAVMSIFLNVLAAVLSPLRAGFKVLLVTIHAFAPLIMVGLAELRTENSRKLAFAERAAVAEADRLAREEAERRRLDTPIVAPSERILPDLRGETSRSAPIPGPRDWRPAASGVAPAIDTVVPAPASTAVQRPLHPVPKPTTVTPLRHRSEDPKRRKVAGKSDAPVKDRIIAYLDKHHRGDPYGITAEELAVKTRQNVHTCKKHLSDWRRGLPSKEAAS